MLKFTPAEKVKPAEVEKECVGCEEPVTTHPDDDSPMCDDCQESAFAFED
jgi:hypothetical protein